MVAVFPCVRYGQPGHEWQTCSDCQQAQADIRAAYQAERDMAEAQYGADGILFTIQVLDWSGEQVRLHIEGLCDGETEGWITRPSGLPDAEKGAIYTAYAPETVETWRDLCKQPEVLQGFVRTLSQRHDLPLAEIQRSLSSRIDAHKGFGVPGS